MADKKISQLPILESPSLTGVTVFVENGVTYETSLSKIKDVITRDISASSINLETSGFTQNYSPLAANINGGLFVITLVSGFSYLGSGTLNTIASTNNAYINAGTITLGGVLDRIRITTVNGTDTFDAGSINILYE